jgi:hypothetical protein
LEAISQNGEAYRNNSIVHKPVERSRVPFSWLFFSDQEDLEPQPYTESEGRFAHAHEEKSSPPPRRTQPQPQPPAFQPDFGFKSTNEEPRFEEFRVSRVESRPMRVSHDPFTKAPNEPV